MPKIEKFIPAKSWIKSYSRDNLKGDLSAGLTVGIMLIPQGMAYAMLAGLPPVYGLYASTIPLIIYALFGTSRQLAVGPVAMVSLLVAAGIGRLADPGTSTYIGMAITLALMVGLLQFMFGIARLGFLVNFLSHPVISGFTSAAAIIIGLSQVQHLTGVQYENSHVIHHLVSNLITYWDKTHWPTLFVGISGISILILLRRINKKIPSTLVVVFLGIVIMYLFNLNETGIRIVGKIPEGLPGFQFPDISIDTLEKLFPAALTIALIGFLESYAIARAIQSKHKDYQIQSNQEMIGLGLSNVFGALFQSFPTNGGFARTAVNDQAGAQTGLAAVFSAILVVLTLLFLTPLFFYLPKAILASIIMVAVYGLIDISEVKYLWKTDKRDLLMLLATFLSTLFLGVEFGILIGVIMSLAMVVYRSTYPHVAILGKVPGTSNYRNTERFSDVEKREDVLIVRFDAQLFFANSSYLRDYIFRVQTKMSELKLIILNAAAINHVDSSAIHMLSDLLRELRDQDIDLYLSSVKGPVRDVLAKSGFMDKLGKDHFFMNTDDAVRFFDGISLDNLEEIQEKAYQNNEKKN